MKNKKRIIILAAVNTVLLLLVAACLLSINKYSHTLLSQQAAKYWAGDRQERFAQVSAFMPETNLAQLSSVMSFRSTLDGKIADTGMELPEEGYLWVDAYSGKGSVTVDSEKGEAKAQVIAVGGSFFNFHPLELLSGSYISEGDLMQDRVVLDYELAWTLFGSGDLEGMNVEINGKSYYVAGVFKREDDKFTDKALAAEPIIFMSYTAATQTEGGSGSSIVNGISCYELAMPNPITNFVENTVKEGFNGGIRESGSDENAKEKYVVVQNSTRYSFGKIFDIFVNFGERSVVDDGVAYPYWENAARVSELYIARAYVLTAALSFIPLICAIWAIVLLIIFIIKKIKQGWAYSREAWDDRYARIEKIRDKREARAEKRGCRKRGPEEKTPGEEPKPFNEQLIAQDVESIVREMMQDNQ